MTKRSIGIEIGNGYLCAVQIAQVGEYFQVEKFSKQPARRATDSLSTRLKSLLNQEGFDENASVTASIPPDKVSFRTVQADSRQIEDLSNAQQTLSRYNFPIDPEDTVTQVYSYRRIKEDEYSVLMAGVSKNTLNEILEEFTQAGIEPQLIDTPAYGIYSTAALNQPEILKNQAVLICPYNSRLIILALGNGNIRLVRNTPLALPADTLEQESIEQLIREIEVTCRKAFESEKQKDVHIYLMSSNKYSTELKGYLEDYSNSQVKIINPLAKVKTSPGLDNIEGIHIAEGLGLRQLLPETGYKVNFSQSENLKQTKTGKFKKDLATCCLLVFAIIVISLIGLFVQKSSLESRYEKITAETEEIFRDTIGQNTKIVAPLAQLNQKLKALQKNYMPLTNGGMNLSPLRTLHIISTNLASDTEININDILITNDSVRITGTAGSFESVYNWQSSLQKRKEFANVQVDDNSMNTENNRVYFTISASTANGGKK